MTRYTRPQCTNKRTTRLIHSMVHAVPALLACCLFSSTTIAGPFTIAVIQGESMSGGGSNIIADESVDEGYSLKVSTRWAATGSMSISETAYKIMVKAMGDVCEGSPTLELLVDGNVVLSDTFHDRNWRFSVQNLHLPPGSYQIGARLRNPLVTSSCRRAVYADVVFVEKAPVAEPPSVPSLRRLEQTNWHWWITRNTARFLTMECAQTHIDSGKPVSDISLNALIELDFVSGACPPVSNNQPNPSGENMPVGDLPGWTQIFTDDFNTDVPLGEFPAAVSDKWYAYPYPWRDTKGQRLDGNQPGSNPEKGGWYHPEKTVAINDGLMKVWLHTEWLDGAYKRLVAAPVPRLFGSNAHPTQGQLYGRYAIRFRAEPVPGYKTAWLLWPDSGVHPRDGEIDFPEGNLTENILGFMHWQNATSGNQQYTADSGQSYDNWHTAVIEWEPDRVAFYLNDNFIYSHSHGTSEWFDRIPNTPMHWVIQSETRLDDVQPTISAQGYIEIDWVAVWRRDPR